MSEYNIPSMLETICESPLHFLLAFVSGFVSNGCASSPFTASLPGVPAKAAARVATCRDEKLPGTVGRHTVRQLFARWNESTS